MFEGFQYPKSNFFKMPNNICETISDLTRTQILAFLYIMRHTWGFSRDDQTKPKMMKFDDFINGRRSRSRKTRKLHRMDAGCGVQAKSTLSEALAVLAEKGLIIIFEDKRDGGRIRRGYRLRMIGDEAIDPIADISETLKVRPTEPGVRSTEPRVRSTEPSHGYSEDKETIEINWGNKLPELSPQELAEWEAELDEEVVTL